MGEAQSDRKEADLIGRLLAGGEDLFRDLLNPRLARPLKRVVHAKIGNSSDPEDGVHQTVLKAFLHPGQFQSKTRFRTWLFK